MLSYFDKAKNAAPNPHVRCRAAGGRAGGKGGEKFGCEAIEGEMNRCHHVVELAVHVSIISIIYIITILSNVDGAGMLSKKRDEGES